MRNRKVAFGSICACTLAVCALWGACAVAAVEVEGIAARVDSSAILKSEIYEEMQRRGLKDYGDYLKIRDELVERKLVLKAAGDAKLVMQDFMIDNRVREIVERSFGGDRNKLIAELTRQKLSYPEWRTRIKDDLVISAMRWNTIDRTVEPSPMRMREEYAAHPERYTLPHRVSVSVILLKPDEIGRRAEVEAAFKTNSFAEVARRYSSDSHASEGGAWTDVDPRDTFRDEVCAELEKIKIGETGNWIELDGWSFLLRKTAERVAHALSFAEAYDDIYRNVCAEECQRRYAIWIKQLKERSCVQLFD